MSQTKTHREHAWQQYHDTDGRFDPRWMDPPCRNCWDNGYDAALALAADLAAALDFLLSAEDDRTTRRAENKGRVVLAAYRTAIT